MAMPAAASAQDAVRGQREARFAEPVAGPRPVVALNHLGFLPKAQKTFLYRLTGAQTPTEFAVREIGFALKPVQLTLPLRKVAGDFGEHLVGDFSQLEHEGLYVASAGGERSVPFFVRRDAWRRALPKAVSYHHAQRCGVAVPNFHPVCHLDDAIRRDNGQYVDLTGGWHDAGDLRKWMDVTMLSAHGLLRVAQNLGAGWNLAGSGLTPLLEEVRWGNRYFRKMQDSGGVVWADVGGGPGNTDNRWTDNQIGSGDERQVNVSKLGHVQPIFVVLQALVSQVFHESDPAYGKECLDAGRRCWDGNRQEGDTLALSWWVLAALELHRATRSDTYKSAAQSLARELISRQNTEFVGDQKMIRGFWRAAADRSTPYTQRVYSALPPLALMELAIAFPDNPDAGRWRDAVRLHLEEYVAPLCGRSVYRIIPYGVFLDPKGPDQYRPLAGGMAYRYFVPAGNDGWGIGLTSQLECYAVLMARAADAFRNRAYRDLAYRQLEWVMGANPFGACLMSGEGSRNPFPYSVFVGLIPGGVMNGISGNRQDEPVLNFESGSDWRTNEYWSPHNAYWEWAVSLLEKDA
jgi:hypothetical protein